MCAHVGHSRVGTRGPDSFQPNACAALRPPYSGPTIEACLLSRELTRETFRSDCLLHALDPEDALGRVLVALRDGLPEGRGIHQRLHLFEIIELDDDDARRKR